MKEAGGRVLFRILLRPKLSVTRKTRGPPSKAERGSDDTREMPCPTGSNVMKSTLPSGGGRTCSNVTGRIFMISY